MSELRKGVEKIVEFHISEEKRFILSRQCPQTYKSLETLNDSSAIELNLNFEGLLIIINIFFNFKVKENKNKTKLACKSRNPPKEINLYTESLKNRL